MARRAALLACLLCLGSGATARAAEWHVAPGGADGAEGSAASPLETFAHAVERASAGDTILLARGGEYVTRGLSVVDLTVGAYGEGPPPVLTASAQVDLPDTWAADPRVRTGPLAEAALAVYVNGRFVRRARYPNEGFLRVDTSNAPDTIVDAELSSRPGIAAGRWVGAQVRWRRWSWWWETRPIVGHPEATTLELGPEGRFGDDHSEAGSGYFIDGDLDELDAPGEWHWEAGALYVFPPAGVDPDTMRVHVVTTSDAGLRASRATLRDLHFTRFGGDALEINRPSTVNGCRFTEIEADAVRCTWDAQPVVIERSVFRDVRNVAIQVWTNPDGAEGSRIERNLFHRIGVERGYGGSGSWHAAGVIVGNARGLVFRLNRVVDTGYAGIILGSDGQTVERNLFARTMQTLNDGGAIYTNCNASVIRENIILDTLGDLETSHPWWPLGHGIWPEFLSDFRDTEIVDNTIFGSNGFGIFLPNNFTCRVEGNLSVAPRRAGLSLSGDAGDQQGHTIVDNTFVALSTPGGRIERPENLSMWWLPPYPEPVPVGLEFEAGLDYGAMSGTTFVTSHAEAGAVRAGDTLYDTVDAWAAAASWADPTRSRVLRTRSALLVFNDTESRRPVALPAGEWTRLDGTAAEQSLVLEPFEGAVLLTEDAYDGPPYLAASGIDWRDPAPTSTFLTLEPEVAVSRGGRAVAVGGVDAVGITGLSGVRLTYTIHSDGGAALTLGAVEIRDASNCNPSVASAPSSEVLAGRSTDLELDVGPVEAGPWSVVVALATNDPDENPASWTITGEARVGGAPDAGVPPGDAGAAPIDGGVPSADAAADAGAEGGGRAIAGGSSCRSSGPGAGALWLLAGAALSVRRRRGSSRVATSQASLRRRGP